MLKVSGHLGGEHHVNDGLPQRPELVPVRGRARTESVQGSCGRGRASTRPSRKPQSENWWWLAGVGWGWGGGPVRVLEDVALAIAHGELEGEGSVVALQHGRVVVQDGQLAACVAQEGVGPARVVHVVHGGRYEGGYLVQLVQAALEWIEGGGGDRVTPTFLLF